MTRKRKMSPSGSEELPHSENVNNQEPGRWDQLQCVITEAGISEDQYVEVEELVDDPLYIGDPNGENNFQAKPQPNVQVNEPERKKQKVTMEKRLQSIILNCEWNMCNLSFQKMEKFHPHIRDHLSVENDPSGEDGFLCYWRECGTFFNTKEELDCHVYFHAFHTKIKMIGDCITKEDGLACQLDCTSRNQIPDLPETFVCMWAECQYQFTSAQEFYWHVQSHANSVDPVQLKNVKKFVCSWGDCTSALNNQLRLKDHMRSHTQEKLVGCPNCGGIFASNTKFYDHCYKQLHHDLKNFQCSHCSRKFSNERLLRDHVRTHINHFKCPQCDMTCPTRVTLGAHIQYRHSDLKPHQCELCEKRFKSLYDLSRHMVVHAKENFYRCTYQDCTRTFRAQSSLNAHVLKNHHGMGPLPFGCHVCERQFASGNGLSKHLIKVHNFRLPEGHTRFKYKQDENGLFRLQMTRYESIELTQENQEEVLSIAGEQHADDVISMTSDMMPASPYSTYTPATPASSATAYTNTPDKAYDDTSNPPTPGSSAYYNPATPASVAASSIDYGTPTSSAPSMPAFPSSIPTMAPLTPCSDLPTSTDTKYPPTPAGPSDHVSLEELVPSSVPTIAPSTPSDPSFEDPLTPGPSDHASLEEFVPSYVPTMAPLTPIDPLSLDSKCGPLTPGPTDHVSLEEFVPSSVPTIAPLTPSDPTLDSKYPLTPGPSDNFSLQELVPHSPE